MERKNTGQLVTASTSQDGDMTKSTLISVTSTTCKGAIFLVMLLAVMATSIIVLAVAVTNCTRDQFRKSDVTFPPLTDDKNETTKSKSGKYRFASVAADNGLCSRIGIDIMARQQGSAVDATIATLLCVGLLNMQSMGIGGGFFMTIYDSEKKEAVTLDSREVAPLAASEDMFVNDTQSSTFGGLAIAVPGEIAGYAEVHSRYGKLPWPKLFEPAIKLCQDGFVISKSLRKAMQLQEKHIRAQPGLRDLFIKADGSMREAGDVIRTPLLARTLTRLAELGPDTFYNGSLADDIVMDIQERGGIITKEDLLGYQPVWKKPVTMHLSNGGYTLYGVPPPSSSVVLNFILSIMDGYNVSSRDMETLEGRVLLTHRLVEAIKFGYGKRSYLGDERFVNVTELLSLLQSGDYASQTRNQINDERVLRVEDYDSAFDNVDDSGTSHLSVYGPDGIAVSVTSTINTHFGSKVLGSRTGILFNNEMDDFSTPRMSNSYNYVPSPSNYISPGKRPMSSMSPTIVVNKDNQVVEVVGASGGSRIITGTLQVIMNTLWLGYDVGEALDRQRLHHQLLPNVILHEVAWPPDILEGLSKKGHRLRTYDRLLSVVQVIRNCCPLTSSSGSEDRCLHAASDVRKGGAPDGY